MTDSHPTASSVKALGFLTLGLVVIYLIIFHDTGGIAGVTQVFGGAFCLYSFLNPKRGLYVLAFFCFYLDFVKKIAVVYGVTSMQTVIEVLAIQMIALGCVFAGSFLRLLLFEQRMNKWMWWTTLGCIVLIATVFGLYYNTGLVSAVQGSINNVGYAMVALALMAYLEDRREMLRYLDFIFWIAIPWGIYGIYQYFMGFPELEWDYAKTWLSPVSSMQMLAAENPRPFGFASGPGGYGVLALIMAYGGWRFAHGGGNRFFMGVGCLVILTALIFSAQRTILLLPFTCAVCYYALKSRAATALLYGSGCVVFLCAVLFAEAIMPRLSIFDSEVNTRGEWANRVIRISTLSNRVRGWERLKQADTYTFFGKRWTPGYEANAEFTSQDHHHDLINTILDNIGVVGLLVIAGLLLLSLRDLHEFLFNLAPGPERNFTAFLLATLIVFTGTMSIGGNNLSSTPNNFVYWTLAGCLLNMRYILRTEISSLSETSAAPITPAPISRSTDGRRMRPSKMPHGWIKLP